MPSANCCTLAEHWSVLPKRVPKFTNADEDPGIFLMPSFIKFMGCHSSFSQSQVFPIASVYVVLYVLYTVNFHGNPIGK